MKTASVRDLRYDFPRVERLLAEGESIEITKRKRVIGTLLPTNSVAAVEFPDFMARMKKIYGNKVLKTTWAEFLAERKGRY